MEPKPAELLARIGATPPPPIAQVLEGVAATLAEIDAHPHHTDAAKRQFRDEALKDGNEKLTAAFASVLNGQLSALDQEEGHARAQLRDEFRNFEMGATADERLTRIAQGLHESHRLERLRVDLQYVTSADGDELRDMFDAAEAAGDDFVMRRLGPAILRRTALLAEESRKRNPHRIGIEPAASLASHLRERFEAWRKANPAPVERLRQIAAQRESIKGELSRMRIKWLRAYGWPDGRSVDAAIEAQARARYSEVVTA